jgi:hypothetical protein
MYKAGANITFVNMQKDRLIAAVILKKSDWKWTCVCEKRIFVKWSFFQYMAIGLRGMNGRTVSQLCVEWQIEHELGHVTLLLRYTVALTVREMVKRLRVVNI